MVKIPRQFPGLKAMTILLGIYGAVWISLEGVLWRAALLAVWTSFVMAGRMLQHRVGGASLSFRKWLAVTAIAGLFLGVSSSLLTLVFMAVKTGLHAHGPEFPASQIEWVLRQVPVWALAGLLAGLGVGLLHAGGTAATHPVQE